jgi:hypothetical protein
MDTCGKSKEDNAGEEQSQGLLIDLNSDIGKEHRSYKDEQILTD